jgi:hypothetical protein
MISLLFLAALVDFEVASASPPNDKTFLQLEESHMPLSEIVRLKSNVNGMGSKSSFKKQSQVAGDGRTQLETP